jgi:predicted NACHT family NTPase
MLATLQQSFSKVYVRQGFYQTLRNYKLEAAILDAYDFEKPLSKIEVNAIRQHLKNLAAAVSASECWSPELDPPQRDKLRHLVERAAEQLKASWEKEFQELVEQRSREGLPQIKKDEACFSLASPNSASYLYADALPGIKLVLNQLSLLVFRAGEFLSAQSIDSSAAMKDDRFIDCCLTAEISHRIPKIVTPVNAIGPRRIEFSEINFRNGGRALLIVGPPGFGKSSYCKWNVIGDLERLAADKLASLPIYVPLHQIARDETKSPVDTFLRSIELKELVANSNSRETINSIRLYLDGLDEIADTERQRELVSLAQQFINSDPRVTVILTAREHVNGWWLNWMPRVRISEFSEPESNELISKWITDDAQRTAFYSQLELAPTLKPLLRTPLLATLVIGVFRNLQRLPENKVRLYEMFVELMTGGWDVAKNIRREVKFGSVMKMSLLVRLAGALHLNEKRDCSETDLKLAMKSVMPLDSDKLPSLMRELIEDGLLVNQGGSFYFAHLSFQEFLAAKDLADPSGRRQTDVLKWYLLGNNWWREVILFYTQMQPPLDVEKWIVKTARSLDFPSLDAAQNAERVSSQLMEHLSKAVPGFQPASFTVQLTSGMGPEAMFS